MTQPDRIQETTCGFHGRYLKVDVTDGSTQVIPLEQNRLRRFLGGVGLGASILLEHGEHRHSPLSPSSSIVFCFSSLVGSPVTTSAKFAVVSRSPLTNLINDAMAGSGFALAGKRTGFDAIMVTGRAATPSVLVIENDEVRLIDAGQWWGQNASSVDRAIKAKIGQHFAISLIGKAGENQVFFATLSHDGRHAGRGGSGAVLGSKNIKAVAVAGTGRCQWASPDELVKTSRELSRRSLGEATKKYRELGTVENLVTLNRLGGLPTHNFQAGTFEAADRFSQQQLETITEKTRSSCAACTIGCEHIYKLKPSAGETESGVTARIEYENLFALGPLCGIEDPAVAIAASQKCDEYGLDTISTGASIAFAMECSQRKLIDQTLEFGNADHLLESIDQIGTGTDLGAFLGQGTMRMSQAIGKDSQSFAPHVKGLEMPGYEPRAMKTMALGYAVQTRGADHNRSGAYEADFAEGSARLKISEASAAHAIDAENRAAIMDSMILCKFVRRVFDDFYDESATLLAQVTGWELDAKELQNTAARIVAAKKLFNIRCGWTPESDKLPDRFFDSQAGEFNEPIDRVAFDNAIRSYNCLRGWNHDGSLSQEFIQQFQLDEC